MSPLLWMLLFQLLLASYTNGQLFVSGPVTGSYLPASASVGTRAFFAGGALSPYPTCSSNIDTFDANSRTFRLLAASLSQPRSFLAAAAAGNKVLFGGGVLSDGYVRLFFVRSYALLTLFVFFCTALLRTWSTFLTPPRCPSPQQLCPSRDLL